MNFDNFVNNLYGKDVFDDENSKYIKDTIFPCLLPVSINKKLYKYDTIKMFLSFIQYFYFKFKFIS